MTTTPPATFRTARLDLIPLRVADAAEMVEVLADPGLYTFIGGAPPTRSELIDRFRSQADGRSSDPRETWLNWIIRDRATGAATGFLQATIVDRGSDDGAAASAEIAWVIGTPWQGRGYATEAARGLVGWLDGRDVRSIVAHVHPDHHASAAVARRTGLEPTDVFVDGERAWRRVTGDNRGAPSSPGGATPR